MVDKGERWRGGMNWDVGIGICILWHMHTTICKIDNQQGSTVQKINYAWLTSGKHGGEG